MTQKDEECSASRRWDDFLQLFRKGAELTRELITENERLRQELAGLENIRKKAPAPAQSDTEQVLRLRIAELEREKGAILERIRAVEEENADFANRQVAMESENRLLADFCAASRRLHSSLDLGEVLKLVSETIITLVEGETFSILLLNERGDTLKAVAAEGVELEAVAPVRLGDGIIGRSAITGTPFFAEKNLEDGSCDFSTPLVCLPMKINDRVVGVILLYRLMVRKKSFQPIDIELFSLLAGHAATAIFSSRLYAGSERKRSTFQGAIELMTS